jgi:hypothetical protein
MRRIESTPLCRLRVGTIEYRFFDARRTGPTGGRRLGLGELRRLLSTHAARPEIRALLGQLASTHPQHSRNHNWLRLGHPSDRMVRRLSCSEIVHPAPALSPGVFHQPQRERAQPFEPNPMFDDERSWIEVWLIGENDEPLAGEVCSITLPNGKVIERRTDRNGLVRVDGISMAGNCDVSFPQLDEDAWGAA